MVDNLDKSSQNSELTYKFTTFDQLKKALADNGWNKNKVDGGFSSLPSSLKVSFPERAMTRDELKKYASKLEVAQTRYEQINLLKQVALEGLKAEIIGMTISFENLTDLEDALRDRSIAYPKKYLEQTGSFMNGWSSSRTLSTTAYESMIKNLKAMEDSDAYVRGEIIATAFNTPAPKINVSTNTTKGVEVSYPEKSKAFADEIRKATSFPFTVHYSEGGKSFEVQINVDRNKIMVGEKVFTLTHPSANINLINLDKNSFLITGSQYFKSRTVPMSKEDFIKDILPQLFTLKTGLSLSMGDIRISVSGSENPKNIAGGTIVSNETQEQVEQGVEKMDIMNIDMIKSGIQQMKPMLADIQKNNPESILAVEGNVGAILLKSLATSGFRVIIKNNLLEVTSSNPENRSYATKLETYFRSEPVMNQILGIGMMYRTSEYQNYSSVYLNADNTVKSGEKRNYAEYLQDTKDKSGANTMTQADKDFLESKASLDTLLKDPTKVNQMLLGKKVIGNANEFFSQNPAFFENMNMAALSPVSPGAAAITPNIPPASPPGVPGAPPAPQTIPSWGDAPVARTLSEIGLGLSKGMNQISNTPGAMQGLLIGFVLTWFFGGFKKAMAFGAGAFGLSAIWSKFSDSGADTGALVQEGKDALSKGADAAGNAASSAVDKATDVVSGSFDVSKLSEFQKAGIEKIRSNHSLVEDINNFSKKPGKEKQNATLDDYISTVHNSSIQNITLDKLIFTPDIEQSIFSNNKKNLLPVDDKVIPNNMSRYLLKKVLRNYIGQNTPLSLPNDTVKEGQSTLDEFKKTYPEKDWKNKTLNDLINTIHKK